MQVKITLRYHLTQVRKKISLINLTANAGEDAEKEESLVTDVEVQIDTAIMEISLAVPQKS